MDLKVIAMSECCKRCHDCERRTYPDVLLNYLNGRYSIEILLWLEVKGPCTLREILDGVACPGGSENVAFLRRHAEEIGLVEPVPQDRGFCPGKMRRRLTAEGHRVAEKLLPIFEGACE